MIPQISQEKIKYLVVALIVVLLLIIYFGVSFFLGKIDSSPRPFSVNPEYREAIKSYGAGNYKESVDALREQVKNDPNKKDLQVTLASSLIKTKEPQAVKEAVDIFVNLITDPKLDPSLAVLACTGLASEAPNLPSADLINLTNRFSTLDASLNASNVTDRFTLYTTLLNKCLTIQKNPFIYYSLAGGNSSSLMRAVSAGSTTEIRKEAASKIQSLIKEGDIYSNVYQTEQMIAAGDLYRARALHASYGQLPENLTLSDIENAYKRGIDPVAEGSPQYGGSVKGYSYLTRFFYANFLIKYYKGERNADARALMTPYAQIAQDIDMPYANFLRSYFISYSEAPLQGNVVKKIALDVANVSPEFKAFLESIAFKSQ